MSFFEIMNLDFGGKNTHEILSKLNLELIENTPEEIRANAAVQEAYLGTKAA